jgi:diketogulonate reductase-like aldo/keto reductase
MKKEITSKVTEFKRINSRIYTWQSKYIKKYAKRKGVSEGQALRWLINHGITAIANGVEE